MNNRRNRRRRRYRPRRKPRARTRRYRMAVSNRIGLSQSLITRMRYCDTVAINPGAGLAATHLFSCNALFDPDITGGGHQPYGRDQFMGIFYDHYMVLGSKITATFYSPASGVSTGSLQVGVSLLDNTTTETDPAVCRERPATSFRLTAGSDSGRPIATVTKGYSPKTFFRSKSRSMIGAAAGANPTEQAYYHVWVAPADAATDTASMFCVITIEYLVLLTEPKQLPGS